ncbi:hypothetical protein HPB48_009448 [Haemaphysalis longicornis]|uniref:Tick transposon n=1 Tax=Haemaphysalis longicornis TaxID=44386 RepID=A0A9J6GE32_HAELO|nr:hypothetical protein HPB48_009448 [Haemaphysalis longicornis]
MSESWGLSTLASLLKKSLKPSNILAMKTRKEECPFRAIVLERGSWQRVVCCFLQAPLARLSMDDCFLMCSSQKVSDFFEAHPAEVLNVFSVDIKDLYYNLPRDLILKAVNDALDELAT